MCTMIKKGNTFFLLHVHVIVNSRWNTDAPSCLLYMLAYVPLISPSAFSPREFLLTTFLKL